jgi:hypothetical protein
MARANDQGSAAASRPDGTAFQVDSKRQKSPDLGAKRSAATHCWAATRFDAFGCGKSPYHILN